MQRLGRKIDIIIYPLPAIAIKMYLAYIERRQAWNTKEFYMTFLMKYELQFWFIYRIV